MKLVLLFVALSVPLLVNGGTVVPADFIATIFSDKPAQAKMLWLNGEQRKQAADILNHSYSALRVRYWQQGQRTAWIVDEIGKERPITIGVVVASDQIEQIKILEYRESRGGEVRYPFFTDQFVGIGLKADTDHKINSTIDGISGATLSVRAVKKVATLALFFHGQVLPPLAKMTEPELNGHNGKNE